MNSRIDNQFASLRKRFKESGRFMATCPQLNRKKFHACSDEKPDEKAVDVETRHCLKLGHTDRTPDSVFRSSHIASKSGEFRSRVPADGDDQSSLNRCHVQWLKSCFKGSTMPKHRSYPLSLQIHG